MSALREDDHLAQRVGMRLSHHRYLRRGRRRRLRDGRDAATRRRGRRTSGRRPRPRPARASSRAGGIAQGCRQRHVPAAEEAHRTVVETSLLASDLRLRQRPRRGPTDELQDLLHDLGARHPALSVGAAVVTSGGVEFRCRRIVHVPVPVRVIPHVTVAWRRSAFATARSAVSVHGGRVTQMTQRVNGKYPGRACAGKSCPRLARRRRHR